MKFTTRLQAQKLTGLSYLGNVSVSQKHEKSEKYGELIYSIFLAPAKISGYEVCPMRTDGCTRVCLHEAGHNRIDTSNRITNSRIKKTKLFFENRDFFVRWLFADLEHYRRKARNMGMKLSVRLNNTSDISPEMYKIQLKSGRWVNVLERFKSVKFYDYTKVKNRIRLLDKYKNYDLTFSYSGENMKDCIEMLENNIRVAMVFENEIPKTYLGYPVINGDDYDMRYKDPNGVIIGLKYKKTRTKLDEKNSFIIRQEKEIVRT